MTLPAKGCCVLAARGLHAEDLDFAQQAIDEIRAAVAGSLSKSPFSFRKSGTSPRQRELIIPFGASGYIALFEIESASHLVILAVRQQLEADYH